MRKNNYLISRKGRGIRNILPIFLVIFSQVLSAQAIITDFLKLNQNITAADRDSGAYFGSTDPSATSMFPYQGSALDESNGTILSSAMREDFDASGNNEMEDAGAVYFFERNPLGYYNQVLKAVASDRAPGDEFGFAVAIDGDYAVIGARYEDEDENGLNTMSNSGSAYIFERVGGVWQQAQKVVASDRGAGDHFGSAVSISGNYIVIGARNEDEDVMGGNVLNEAGAAYIFERIGGVWQQVQKIVASDRATEDVFGCSVAIFGNDLMVGAMGKDTEPLGPGQYTAVNAGAVYAYENVGGVWTEIKILADSFASTSGWTRYGMSLSLAENHVVTAGYDQGFIGGVYSFRKVAGVWGYDNLYLSPTGGNDMSGLAVAAKDNKVMYSEHTAVFPSSSIGVDVKMFNTNNTVLGYEKITRLNYNDNPNIPEMGQGCFTTTSPSGPIFGSSLTFTDNNELVIGGMFCLDVNGNNHLERAGGLLVYKMGAEIIFDSLVPLSCAGPGYASVHVENGVPPFSYEWSTNPPTLDSVVQFNVGGNYTLTVVDGNNDTTRANVQMPFIQPVSSNIDLSVVNWTSGVFFPGATGKRLLVVAKNATCSPATGTLDIRLDPQTNYSSAVPAPDQIIGDTLRWNFTNIIRDSADIRLEIFFDVQTTAGATDTLCFYSTINPILGDLNPGNNKDELCFPVVSSFDPNDKKVTPKGACDEGYVLNSQTLTYRIRYQNTGTDTARNIYILDTLDTDLDIGTFDLLSQSHNGFVEQLSGNVLKFNYPGIMLPDSNVNEPASHGYIIYNIDQQVGLMDGTEIENSASIYFDFNAPVITNTVKNTLASTIPQCVVSVTELNGKTSPIGLYPNPSEGQFTFTGLQSESTIAIYDLSGKLMMEYQVEGPEFTISLNHAKSGLYMYKIVMDKSIWNGRLIIKK